VVLTICAGPLNLTATWATLISWFSGALVSYVLSRWAWKRKGRPNLLRETLPFWVVSAMVVAILTVATKFGYQIRTKTDVLMIPKDGFWKTIKKDVKEVVGVAAGEQQPHVRTRARDDGHGVEKQIEPLIRLERAGVEDYRRRVGQTERAADRRGVGRRFRRRVRGRFRCRRSRQKSWRSVPSMPDR